MAGAKQAVGDSRNHAAQASPQTNKVLKERLHARAIDLLDGAFEAPPDDKNEREQRAAELSARVRALKAAGGFVMVGAQKTIRLPWVEHERMIQERAVPLLRGLTTPQLAALIREVEALGARPCGLPRRRRASGPDPTRPG